MRTNKTSGQKILIEQVTLLFQSMASLLLINLFVCICLAFGFWNIVPNSYILSWCALMLIMLLVRTYFYMSYKRSFNVENLMRFRVFLIIGSASAGLVWGLGGVLLFSDDLLIYQVLLVFSLMAMTGGSTFTLSIYLPTFFAFSPMTLLPIGVKFFTLGETIHYSLGFVTLVYLAALTTYNIKINRNFKRTLELRFENLELIEQLKNQRAEADRANTAKSKFLAAASHDLRQPLYSLSLFTTVLDESTKDPKTRKIVDQINQSVESLTGLFDALLDISKLDAGVVSAEKESFELQGLFEALANDFDLQAAEKGLTINWPSCDYIVYSVDNLLEQILRNYLSNAIRYTESGSITVSCKTQNGMITINVIDSGIGILKEDFQEIFTEFHQLGNNERNRNNGLGLGLAIVDRTAKLLDHEINVKSELGKGSTFSVKVEQTQSAINTIPNTYQQLEHIKYNEALLVVVIDDEKSIREGMQHLLELWDYQVISGINHQDVFKQLQSINKKPDAIISDFRLTDDQTGVDAINQLLSIYNTNIPAIIVTGDIDKKRLEDIKKSRFSFLSKPVPPAKLRAFLRSAEKHKAKPDIN